MAHQQQDIKVTTPVGPTQVQGVIGAGHPSPVQQEPRQPAKGNGSSTGNSGRK